MTSPNITNFDIEIYDDHVTLLFNERNGTFILSLSIEGFRELVSGVMEAADKLPRPTSENTDHATD